MSIMHWFDISVIALLLLSTAYSFLRGLTKELFSFFAYLIAFILAHRYYSLISERISGFIQNDIMADVVSFGFIFIFSAFLVGMVGNFFRRLIYKAKTLNFLDRAAGGVIGLIKGALIIAVIMIPVGLFPISKKKVQNSKLAPYILDFSRELSKASFSDKNILKKMQNKIKFPDMKGKLKMGLNVLKERLKEENKDSKSAVVKERGKRKDKVKGPLLDDITEEDKKKLEKLIDDNL